jgi:molybdopterin/thiamine biosynthesis adenylyltransferase
MLESLSRYSRQILFAEIGKTGQQRLLESKVVIVGCGALGTVQAESLCRAGVGTIRIVDRDFVEESNLQRQTLFCEEDARNGLPKAVAAQKRLAQINSQTTIEPLVADVNFKNIERLVDGMDCILDATDNFETRFLINDVSVRSQIPWVYGAAVGAEGLTMTILPGRSSCLRCVFEQSPPPGMSPTCDTSGVLAPIVNIIASIQVAETLKILTGNLDRVSRKLLSINVWESVWKQLDVSTAKALGTCPCCNDRRFDFLEGKVGSLATTLCGRDSVQISSLEGTAVDFRELARRLEPIGPVHYNQFLLRFNVDRYEIAVFADGRSIVRGTKDTEVARTVFSKYIGA